MDMFDDAIQDELDEDQQGADEPEGRSRLQMVTRLLIGGALSLLMLPMIVLASTLQSENEQLTFMLGPTQTALAGEPVVPEEDQEIGQSIDAAQAQINALVPLQSTLEGSHVDWTRVVPVLSSYDSQRLEVAGLSQTANQLILTGTAENEGAVIAYARQLEDSGYFKRVIVQSITLLDEPFGSPTPEMTPTPTITTTPTPASSGGGGGGGGGGSGGSSTEDTYEVDNTQPVPIFIGQPQARTFYPAGDIDNVTFLAKAGRHYTITTANLAPGVDTVLLVSYDDESLKNDDFQPGTLASSISFQAPKKQDVTVMVQITNRGQYGKSQAYLLTIEEVVPTKAPESTPKPRPTEAPTATPRPTDTPTPDGRDSFEPDDSPVPPIGLGEAQARNFYPAGDVDYATFTVKRDRYYTVTTSNLAYGVDTYLEVDASGNLWVNDDYQPFGTGDLSSGVCFRATDNGNGSAMVTNITGQSGPDKAYTLSIKEVPGLQLGDETVDFGPYIIGDPNPPARILDITSPSPISWTAAESADWLQIDTASGSTPAQMAISVDFATLPPGSHASPITLTWSAICSVSVLVSVDVDVAGLMPERSLVKEGTGTLHPVLFNGLQPSLPPYQPLTHANLVPSYQGEGGQAVKFVILVELKGGTT